LIPLEECSFGWLVGLGDTCTPQDHELFAVATKVTIDNEQKMLFWEASWLNGPRRKDITPLILKLPKKKMHG
jgi:hypothetical protein